VAILRMTGFELKTGDCLDYRYDAVPSVGQVRTGERSLRAINGAYGILDLGGDHDYIYLQIAVYYSGGTGTNTRVIGQLLDLQNEPQLTIAANGTTNRLEIHRGSESGVVIASGGYLALDNWNVVELCYYVNNVSGIAQLRLNGTLVASVSGNTQHTVNPSVHILSIGCTPFDTSHGCHGWYDDIVVCDRSGTRFNTWVNQARIGILLPTSDESVDFTPHGAANNYDCIGIPPLVASYVYTSAIGDIDIYEMSSIPDIPDEYEPTNIAVQSIISAKNEAAQIKSITPVLLDPATLAIAEGTPIGVDVSYDIKSRIFEFNPTTGLDWDRASVNAIRAGFKLSNS